MPILNTYYLILNKYGSKTTFYFFENKSGRLTEVTEVLAKENINPFCLVHCRKC